jgi:hypothetical protein
LGAVTAPANTEDKSLFKVKTAVPCTARGSVVALPDVSIPEGVVAKAGPAFAAISSVAADKDANKKGDLTRKNVADIMITP